MILQNLHSLKNLAVSALTIAAVASGSLGDETDTPPGILVETHTVATADLIEWQMTEGIVEAVAKAFLQFETSGRIAEIGRLADQSPLREGARVYGPGADGTPGQLLARLDAWELEADLSQARAEVDGAQQRVTAAEAALAQGQADFERQTALADRNLIPRATLEAARAAAISLRAQVDEARAAEAAAQSAYDRALIALNRMELRAPFDGVISRMAVREGGFFTMPVEQTTAAQKEANSAIILLDDSRYEVVLHLPPFQAEGLREGQTALIGSDSADIAKAARGNVPPSVVAARVWAVSPSISLDRRAVLVRIRTDAAIEDQFRDGDFVGVWIAAQASADAVVLPYRVLQSGADGSFVYRITADDRAERVAVETGLYGLEQVEILTGLSPGDEVVLKGQHLLYDAAPVRRVSGTTP